MATFLAGAVVMLAAAYLLAFGTVALAFPARASVYLHGFARSLRVHLLELAARAAVGGAFLWYAFPAEVAGAFRLFGMILLLTTMGLALLPWRWHRRFTETAVPAARPYLRGIGVVAIAAGVFVFWAAVSPLVR